MWWGNSAGIDGMWWGNRPEICWAKRCCVPGGSCEGERPEATDPSLSGRGSSTRESRLVASRVSPFAYTVNILGDRRILTYRRRR